MIDAEGNVYWKTVDSTTIGGATSVKEFLEQIKDFYESKSCQKDKMWFSPSVSSEADWGTHPLLFFTTLTTMWSSKLYQKSARDACLLNIRNDFAELIMVDPVSGNSKHIYLHAPLKLINKKVEELKQKGYKELDSINLSLRGLAAVWTTFPLSPVPS